MREKLLNAYERGFIDRNTNKTSHYPPELIINTNGNSLLSPMLDALEMCDDFSISVAFITEGGLAALKTVLYELSTRGVKGRIITSTYLNFNKPKVFKELLKIPNVEVRITSQVGFHAKGYIFDNKSYSTMFIGSSNLTDTALKKSYEYNLKLTSLDNGEVINYFKDQFNILWESSDILNVKWIEDYEVVYKNSDNDSKILEIIETQQPYYYKNKDPKEITPNIMQEEALESLKNLRLSGERKGLIVSATGTGKTFLSAFDVKRYKPKRVLFIAHREQILIKTLNDYRDLIGGDPSEYGINSGTSKSLNSKYIFATVQTFSRDDHLKQFKKDAFDYIVIDEAHRSSAESYKKIINYFTPKFLLGMTATPERTDGNEIFGLFDFNIAYEIRLQKALEAEILSPFHYFGVTDHIVDGQVINDESSLYQLVDEERINHIIDKLNYYSHEGEYVRGLMFVSNQKEAIHLSSSLNNRGFKTQALIGSNSQEERDYAVNKLVNNELEYLITVDIFNEGVDIPSVNQVVMLRQTQSSIIFIQQLGRGLRKHNDKKFLTVIDFIGNYKNNYLIPIALTGDKSFNKDSIRRDIVEGNLITGESTINFEHIAKERIYKSISAATVDSLKNLKEMYFYTKNKLGKIPSLMDLYNDKDSMDPMIILNKYDNYSEFLNKIKEPIESINSTQYKILMFISKELIDGKRITEILLLEKLLDGPINKFEFQRSARESGYCMDDSTLKSIIRILNIQYFAKQKKDKYRVPLIDEMEDTLMLSEAFQRAIESRFFKDQIEDLFQLAHKKSKVFNQGEPLTVYEKYSRSDVCRLLNWEKDESSTMYGYKTKYNTSPIFVNYHKTEDVDESIRYEDAFLDSHIFQWFTRKGTNLESKINQDLINNYKNNNSKIYLFVKRDDDEGIYHYYLGEVDIDFGSMKNTFIGSAENKYKVATMNFILKKPLEYNMYRFITGSKFE